MERVAIRGVCERSECPGAHVAGKEEHALAATASGFEIFGAVDDDDARDVLTRIFRELRKFGGHPAYLTNHAANDLISRGFAQFGKCELQIEHGRAAQRAAKRVCDPRETRSDKPSERPRQKSQ